jgi:hypothetical protein
VTAAAAAAEWGGERAVREGGFLFGAGASPGRGVGFRRGETTGTGLYWDGDERAWPHRSQ